MIDKAKLRVVGKCFFPKCLCPSVRTWESSQKEILWCCREHLELLLKVYDAEVDAYGNYKSTEITQDAS